MIRRTLLRLLPILLVLPLAAAATAQGNRQAPLRSGPQVGERPLPFTSNCVTGENRGRQHCYICELKDETAVLVFARKLDEPTARLMKGVRDWLKGSKSEEAFGWFVFLGPKGSAEELAMERDAYEFARVNGCTQVPITALGELQGPPGYLIHLESPLTVLVFRQGKVLHNRAYRVRDWNNRAADALVKELPKLTARDQ